LRGPSVRLPAGEFGPRHSDDTYLRRSISDHILREYHSMVDVLNEMFASVEGYDGKR